MTFGRKHKIPSSRSNFPTNIGFQLYTTVLFKAFISPVIVFLCKFLDMFQNNQKHSLTWLKVLFIAQIQQHNICYGHLN